LAGACAGFFVMTAPGVWRWLRQGSGHDGTPLYLRMHTSRAEWHPRHVVLIAAFIGSVFIPDAVPEDSWLSWVAFFLFMALMNSLKSLPIHRGRRPPESRGPEPQL